MKSSFGTNRTTMMGTFLAGAIAVSTLTSIAARADERQNGGDLIRQYFALGIDRAYTMAEPVTGTNLKVGRVLPKQLALQFNVEKLRNWFDANKPVLMREIEQIVVNDSNFDVTAWPQYRKSCAFTAPNSGAMVYISLENCANSVNSADDAAAILIGEALHHMKVIKPWTPKNEDFAVAWLAGVIRQTYASIAAEGESETSIDTTSTPTNPEGYCEQNEHQQWLIKIKGSKIYQYAYQEHGGGWTNTQTCSEILSTFRGPFACVVLSEQVFGSPDNITHWYVWDTRDSSYPTKRPHVTSMSCVEEIETLR